MVRPRSDRDGATTLTAVRRLLDAEAEIPTLLAVLRSERPRLESAVVLVRDAAGWRRAAGIDHAAVDGTAPGPTAPVPAAAGTPAPVPAALVAAARPGKAVRIGADAFAGVLPEGTRSAVLVSFGPRGAPPDCLVVLGTAGASAIDDDDALVAEVAGERIARLAYAERLDARSAEADHARRTAGGFRDQVLAIVGHDLRNPLGAITMSASLLHTRGQLGGWQVRAVERIRSSASRMGRIIDDLLGYTRTRLGSGIPVVRRPADLADVVKKILDEVHVVHPQAAVELEHAGDLSGSWDPARLEQVISNLLSNAIDHGDEGAPVRVGLCGGSDRVEFAVVNDGEIPKVVLEHAFEAFHRCPEQEARKASGLGLGLYIAREIVQRHGGEIVVRCGGGRTHVLVSLPRVAEGTDAAPSPA